jgi:hypothetical protein
MPCWCMTSAMPLTHYFSKIQNQDVFCMTIFELTQQKPMLMWNKKETLIMQRIEECVFLK